MSISMYSASVPVYSHTLGSLERILDKAEANAAARKFDPAVMLGLRPAPAQLPPAQGRPVRRNSRTTKPRSPN